MDGDMALKAFDQVLEHCTDHHYRPTSTDRRRRYYRKFFTFVAEQIGDERLRKDGLQILTAVRVHGIPPPLILQNRLISAWASNPPEQVLKYFEQMREEGVTLSGCITAIIGGGRTADAPIGQNDPTRDAEQETLAAEDPEVLHTATERTPLRTDASTFVPKGWEVPWQTPSAASMLRSFVSPSAGMCDKFPQVATQQLGIQRDENTTVMLRNLPCCFLREDLIGEMDAKGFAGLYNFVYVPTDFHTQMGMGYAFVNMALAKFVQPFMLSFDGFKGWPRPSSKVCAVDLSRTQGLDANIWRHRNSPVMRDEVPERFRPVLFQGTERVPFLEFTREVPASRAKSIEW